MSEELELKVLELTKENQRLQKVNRTLRARLKRMQKRQEDLTEEIEELDTVSTIYVPELKRNNVCSKCGAETESINMNTGTLYLCKVCPNRHFTKS